MEMTSDGEALTGLHFAGSRKGACSCEERDLPVFRETRRWLDEYFSGREPDFTPPYRIDGLTPFRKAVIGAMLRIPLGKTATYGGIAAEIARRRGLEKMSAQAVGGAVGHNAVSLIIPCHRIVGADGSLTGYAGGLDRKVRLLRLEQADMSRLYLPKKS